MVLKDREGNLFEMEVIKEDGGREERGKKKTDISNNSSYHFDQTGTNPYTVKPTLSSVLWFIGQATVVLTASTLLSRVCIKKFNL